VADDEKSLNEKRADWAEEAQEGDTFADDEDVRKNPPTYGDVFRWTARILSGALAVLLLVMGVALLLLQTPWGARTAKNVIVDQLNPLFNDARLQVDSLSGNFVSRIRLYDTEFISTKTGERMAYVDTATASYNLLLLFKRRVVISNLDLANPSVAMTQQPGGGWDLLKAFPADTTRPVEESVFALKIDDLDARDARLRAEFHDPGAEDPVLAGNSLNLALSDLEQGDALTVDVDTTWGTFEPPGAEYDTRLRASGALGDSLLHVNGLRLTSPRSNLWAAGTLRPPARDTDEPVRDIDFALRADPVAFRDLLPLAPSLDPDGRGTIELDVTGTSQLLSVEGEAQFGDGSSVSIDGQATPFAEDELSYQLRASLSRLNPGYFTAGGDPQPALLNAEANVDLTGTDLQQLNGSASASLSDSRVGDHQIRQASLESSFTDGKADFEASASLRGAEVSAEGTGRFFADVPSYQVTGRFAQVELGTLLNDPQLSSNLNGRFQVEGVAFALATANVQADVSLANSTLNGQRVNEGTANFTLSSGELSYNARLDTPGSLLAFRGRASFEGPSVRYWIDEGNFRNLNLATFTGNPQQQMNLTGTLTARGTGLDPQSMNLSGNLSLESGSYGKYRIRSGQFDVNLRGGRTTFNGQLALRGGSFDVSGGGRFFQPTPTYRLEGNFQQVDIGTLTQSPDQSSTLNGRLTLDGAGFDPQTARLTADLSLQNSVLNDQPINQGTANVSLRGGNLSYDMNFKSPGGAFLARGTGAYRNGIWRYQIDEGRFSNVNVALFTGNPANTSDLSGTFSGEGSGTSLATLSLDLHVNLSEGRFNQQALRAGVLDVTLREGDLDVKGSVETPEGQFAFAGGGNLLGPSVTFTLRDGSFSGLNLGALLNNPNLQTSLNGTVDLNTADLASRTFEGTITLRPSTVNRLQLRSGTIRIDAQQGSGTARAQIDFASGALNVTAEGNLTGTPTYQADGTIRNLDLGALTSNDSLQTLQRLAFDVQGEGTNPRTMTLGGRVVADTLLLQDATLYGLQSRFQLRNGLLRVDTVTVRGSFANAHGGGRIALFDPSGERPSDFFFRTDIDDLAPVQPFVPVRTLALNEGFVEAHVYGPADRLTVEGNARLSSLAYNDIRVASFEGRFSSVLDSLRRPMRGTVRAEAGYFSLPTLTIENTDLRSRFSDTSATFTLDMRVDKHRDLTASGQLDLRPGRERLQVDSLQMNLAGDRWQLSQPASISYSDNRYRVSNLLVYADDQQIALDGVVDPDGEQNLVFTVEQFEVGAVADLLDYQGLSGTLSGSISLTGPAAAPEADGTLMLDLKSYGETAGDLRLQLAYADQRLNVDALLANQDASTLHAEGYVPIDLRIAPGDSAAQGVQVRTGETAATEQVNLTVQADSFAVDWIRPFLQPNTVENLDGRIEADVQVGGTFGSPQLTGSASFVNGRFELPQFGVAYRDIEAETQLADNQMTVERFALRTGNGSLTGSGTINLANLTLGEFDLQGRMNEFRAIDTREYSATLDGDLSLSGTTQQPVLRGGIDVLSADIYIGQSTGGGAALEQVQLTDTDVRQLESSFGLRLSERDTTSFDFYQALDMQLDVNLQRDTWLRQRINPEINIQLTGNLNAQKQPYNEINLYGTIDAVGQRSYVEVAQRRFEITEGVVRFNGDPANPTLDVRAEYAARAPTSTRQTAATITLTLRGPLQNLEPTLGSGEGLSGQDIASLLGTGQQVGQGGAGGLGAAGQAGGQILLGQVTNLVEGAADKEFGLDVFEINPLGPRGELTPTLTAGKYLTRRFYAGIYQPLTSSSPTREGQIGTGTQITLEYQFLQWLLARLSQSGNGLRFDLFWEYSY
jgi:translocation and assembly module TamB